MTYVILAFTLSLHGLISVRELYDAYFSCGLAHALQSVKSKVGDNLPCFVLCNYEMDRIAFGRCH